VSHEREDQLNEIDGLLAEAHDIACTLGCGALCGFIAAAMSEVADLCEKGPSDAEE